MHTEHFSIDPDTAARLNKAKKENKRIISVGTTTTRVLETCANTAKDKLTATTGDTNIFISGETNLFIYPPYKFKFVDSLITNFHLPHSTLLALISAFVSSPNTTEEFINFESSLIGRAYNEAIENKYRFYSFGDASIIM
jgi:S-adenosylmethionine:tRNA ribosyltransferase-isomerase